MDIRADLNEPSTEEMNNLILRLMKGINGQAFRLFGERVRTGPFVGMIIPAQTPHWDDGNSGTKLFGVYEHELHDAIEFAIWRRPQIVYNVGCAEGYYAIGLARRGLNVCGLDIDEEALLMCEDYAEKNKVKVTLVKGARTPEELRFSGQSGHRLYLIDCEGNEETLIDFGRCPELARSDIIVECHDFMRPHLSSIIADRLTATHRVVLVTPKLPNLGQFQFIERFPAVLGMLMLTEKRPMPCFWLACWANSKGD